MGLEDGFGLIPYLSNLFGSSSSPDSFNVGSQPSGPAAVNAALAQGYSPWATSNPNNGPANYQGTGLSAAEVAAVSPNPQQSISAYNAAGGNKPTDLGSLLNKVGAGIQTAQKSVPGMPGLGQQQTYVPPVPPMAHLNGGGPLPSLSQTAMPNQLMMSMKLPSGGLGSPLGYAAQNPLLAFLRSRLSVM